MKLFLVSQVHHASTRSLESPTLPVEVCERVIDYVAVESAAFVPSSGLAPQYQLRQRHMDMVACALTCRAWLARSVYHLSTRAMIHNRRQLEGLAQSMKDDPRRGSSIRSLYICSPPRPYTPQDGDQSFSQWSHLAPIQLAGHLPSLDKLILVDLNWRNFHPSFAVLTPRLTQSVTTLWIHRLLIDHAPKLIMLLALFPSLYELRVANIVYSAKTSRRPILSPRSDRVVFSNLETLHIASTSQLAVVVPWLSGKAPHLQTLRLDILDSCPSLLQSCSYLADLTLKFTQLSVADMEETWGAMDLSEIKALQYLRLEGDEFQLTSFAKCLSTLRGAEVKEISLSSTTALHSIESTPNAAPRCQWLPLDSLLTREAYPKLKRVAFTVKTVMHDYTAYELFPLTYSRGLLVTRIHRPDD